MAFWNRKRGRSAESETPQPAPSEQLSAAPAPTWKTIPPTDACDIVDFWFRQAWPLTESEVTELAVAQLGWTTVEEDGESFLNNTVHALSMTAFAEKNVLALASAFDVVSPDELVYKAWREPEPLPRGVTLSDEQIAELDPGENPLLIPSLGLATQA